MTTNFDVRPQASSRRPAAWWSVIALIAAMLVTFLLMAAIGAVDVERGERVLGLLDPAFEVVRQLGPASLTWLTTHSMQIGWVVTAAAAATALVGLLAARRRAASLIPLAAGVCLATWGQILLLGDRLQLGAWLYGCGVACAVVLGVTDPIQRLAGFPRLPLPADRSRAAGTAEASGRHLPWSWECAVIFLLVLAALFTRLYALAEMPSGFDLETIGHMIESRTLTGLRRYLQFDFLSSAPGIVHLLPQTVLLRLFGTSAYTVRLTATFWGVAAVPLFYWLVRRIAGVGPAVVSTVLFIAAPEQLFWSRSENGFFAPVAVVALITAHLGLWMVERLSFAAVLATALWMPFCRYFYVPSMILFAYPLILGAHTLVFVRGAWRKAWYAVPALGAGLALWIFSLSFLFAYVNWEWRFVNPAIVYGAPAWTKQGQFRGASFPELVRLQTASVAKNVGLLLQGMVETDRFPTHWYQRYTVGKNSSLNVGFAVLVALGIGYLAGQVYERRAAVLLVWFVLGLLPACLSTEASARRMAVSFPAAEAIAGVMLAALVRIVRVRAGRWLAWLMTGLLGIAVIGIVWTSLASHFLTGMARAVWIERARFAKPIFEESDMVVTDILEGRFRGALLLESLDRFVQSPPCWQSVGVREWPEAALRPRCDFTDDVYMSTMPPERISALQAAYHPRRISYLLDLTATGLQHLSLLRTIYPAADMREWRNSSGQTELVALTVDLADVTALHSPALVVASPQGDGEGVQSDLLANVPLVRTAAAVNNEGLAVRGGLLLEHDGWYRFKLEPECSQAELKIDGHLLPPANEQPMLSGVHPFEITLPSASVCRLPLRFLMQSNGERAMVAVPAGMFVSPAVAAITQAQAPPVRSYAGYGDAKVFAEFEGMPVGFGIDGNGHVTILVVHLGAWRMHRFDPDGHEEAAWPLPFSVDPNSVKMAVDADGTSILAVQGKVFLYDRAGELSVAWDNDLSEFPAEIALWHKEILIAIPQRDAIILATRDGRVQEVFKEFEGGPGRFHSPVAVSVAPTGEILVIEGPGQALLFRNTSEVWKPEFVRAFSIDFARLPAETGGSAFDEQDRILVPDRSAKAPLVYARDGERMLAESPERDLSTKGFHQAAGFQPTSDRVYVLDRAANRLLVVSR